MPQEQENGFSLIELLIVIAIILIIAAIAIPNLLRSKISANEAATVASMRTINTAQASYQVAYPATGYADTMLKLGSPPSSTAVSSTAAGLVEWVTTCTAEPCPKSGYLFSIAGATGTPVDFYTIQAVPISVHNTGDKGFCMDSNNSIKYDPNGGTVCSDSYQ